MSKALRAIDLFAGIGGIRMGVEGAGRVKTVFAAEWDRRACETYKANFGHDPFGDVTKIKEEDIPDFDLVLAGFPCQAFSIAGKKGGFDDTRGTLFFDVARIIKHHRPKGFLLENVKGLVGHDKGRTLNTILNVLTQDLGYKVHHKVINARDHNVPQKRERVYIVGFRDFDDGFSFPRPEVLTRSVSDIMEENPVSSRYYVSDVALKGLRSHRARHEAKGHGFGYEIIPHDGVANTLVTGGMGRERNLVIDPRLEDRTPCTNIQGEINAENIRKMTPREWARLQGFPDDYVIPVSHAAAYKQFGNSVCVPIIRKIAKKAMPIWRKQGV